MDARENSPIGQLFRKMAGSPEEHIRRRYPQQNKPSFDFYVIYFMSHYLHHSSITSFLQSTWYYPDVSIWPSSRRVSVSARIGATCTVLSRVWRSSLQALCPLQVPMIIKITCDSFFDHSSQIRDPDYNTTKYYIIRLDRLIYSTMNFSLLFCFFFLTHFA